ncbi:MAG: hypothetical protein LWX01_06635 [Deltaproteobacteria bacterium]|nr:hypothetical protein [Deltaproteobacteria bacterium]MDL1961364.1 hypothetical protein [Deltaproteobacteria bacterium]
MKKKIGTLLEEDLIFDAKRLALSQKQPFSKVLEDALRMYLLTMERKTKLKRKNISLSSYGAMNISPSVLKSIMEEESVYET